MKIKIARIAILLIIVTIIIIAYFSYQQYSNIPAHAEDYITNKKDSLEQEARKDIKKMFIHDRVDVFPIYSECKSRFVKGDYLSQTGAMYKDVVGVINKNSIAFWGVEIPKDMGATYHVAPQDPMVYYDNGIISGLKLEIRMQNCDTDDGPERGIIGANWKGIWQTGWALGVNENWGDKIVQYIIIPYAISYRKQSFGTLEGYLSVDNILDQAFKFYTENINSGYARNLVNDVRKFSWGPFLTNEYYTLEESKDDNFVLSHASEYANYGQYMYNDSYYVFIKAYGKKMYELKLKEEYVKNDKILFIDQEKNKIKRNFTIEGSSLLVLLVFSIIFVIVEKKKKKRTLLQKIILKSNPKLYLKNYDEKKLHAANDIYSLALSVDKTNEEEIIKLAIRAEEELNIILLSKEEIENIKKQCNPKRFMKHYDAEKVNKANSLYSKIHKNLTFAEYIKIKNKIDEIL